MNEDFLHYIWKNTDYPKISLISDTGEKVNVIDVGVRNTNQGPDFTNAKIELNGQLWAGNIEIHTISSHWYQHGHNRDNNYDNVILHVVAENDNPILNSKGRQIPTVTLPYPKEMEAKYNELMLKKSEIPCYTELPQLDNFRVSFWLESLVVERIETKTEQIKSYLESTKNDWNEAFYITLCRYFGMKVNADPFERLARALPLKIINKHHNNVFQLEALLYGQSGLLPDTPSDEYTEELIKEYKYLKKKYQLISLDSPGWNYHRLRPVNFPTIRISQLANLIAKSSHLFSTITTTESVKELKTLLQAGVSEYWESHYQFGKSAVKKTKNTGAQFAQILIINTVIPFLFVYGKIKPNSKITDRALEFLQDLPSEKNSIVSLWEEYGIKSLNSSTSQALIHLKSAYCDRKACIKCQIGHMVLSRG